MDKVQTIVFDTLRTPLSKIMLIVLMAISFDIDLWEIVLKRMMRILRLAQLVLIEAFGTQIGTITISGSVK